MSFNVTEKVLVEIEEKGSSVYLVQGYIGQDGEFKAEFCKKKNWNTREMDDVKPLSIYLGKGREGLMKLAKYIMDKYGDGNNENVRQEDELIINDIPIDGVPF